MSTYVKDSVASAALLSDGSGSFTEPPYGDAFSTTTNQFTHSGGNIQRSGAGWGSFTWGTSFGPDTVAVFDLAAVGESDFIVRGKDIGGSNWDGYDAYYSGSGSWELYRVINAGGFVALTTASVTLAANDQLGMVAIGSGASVIVAVAQYTGGAWGDDFMAYTDTNASRLVNSGVIGAWANGTALKINNLYGGTITAAAATSTPGRRRAQLPALLQL